MKQVLPQPEGPKTKILEGVLNRNASPNSIPLGNLFCFSVGSLIFEESAHDFADDGGKSTKGSLSGPFSSRVQQVYLS